MFEMGKQFSCVNLPTTPAILELSRSTAQPFLHIIPVTNPNLRIVDVSKHFPNHIHKTRRNRIDEGQNAGVGG